MQSALWDSSVRTNGIVTDAVVVIVFIIKGIIFHNNLKNEALELSELSQQIQVLNRNRFAIVLLKNHDKLRLTVVPIRIFPNS